MKILLTGGAGFIGSNFAVHALKEGHTVINIDALTYAGNLNNLDTYQTHPHHHFHPENICNRAPIQKIFHDYRPDVVLHMAAESHVDRSIDCADAFIDTNIMGTYTLLDVSLNYYRGLKNKNDFKFIHLSTDEVFGALGKSGKFNEASPYRPNSPYAASKAASDMLVRSYYQTYGFPTIIVNSSNNYGPKQYAEKLIPLMIISALEQKPLPVYGDGQQVRDWLHVEDHVYVLELLITSGKIGESYCIGSDNEISNLELVKKICDILDELKPSSQLDSYRSLISFVTDRPGHDFRYATDASKIKSLGWTANISLEEGLRKTIQWYLDDYKNAYRSKNAHKRIGLGK